MFARATNRSYTCLKCQYRLFLQENRGLEPQKITPRVRQRWHSFTAKAAVKDEPYDDVPDSEDKVQIRYDSTAHNPYSSRRWRPTPTAEIGVDVLGKPAEILLLPGRRQKRRKDGKESDEIVTGETEPKTTEEGAEDVAQPSIHESLAAESQPTSMTEALENIEKIWEEARTTAVDGFLERDQWTKYFNALSTGFTKAQIERYLEQNKSASESSTNQGTPSLSGRTFTRRTAATEIMTNLWGFSNDLPMTSDRTITKTIILGRGRRELIFAIDKEWRRFTRHLSIRLGPNRREIEVTGPETWVMKAQTVFASLKRRTREHHITLPDQYAKALEEQKSASDLAIRSMLLDLIDKHQVTLTNSAGWTIFAFHVQNIFYFERDLLLSQKYFSSHPEGSKMASSLPLTPIDTSVAMPVYGHVLASGTPTTSRYICSQNQDDSAQAAIDLDSGAVRELVANIEGQFSDKSGLAESDKSSRSAATTIDDIVYESSATIGQVLHYNHRLQHKADIDGGNPLVSSKPIFRSTIPFLSQFISAQKQVSRDRAEQEEESIIRLTFVPQSMNSQPEIEVEASTFDPLTGRSKITMRSVKLVYASNSAHVLLSTTPFDLEFEQRNTVSFFKIGTNVNEAYAPLLGQLGSQLRREGEAAKYAKRTKLKTLIDLDMDTLPVAVPAEVKKNSRNAKTKTPSVRFALDKAEIVERRAYQIHEQDEVVLEHTAYTPLPESSVQESREVLRVVPKEGNSSAMSTESRAGFTKCAFQAINVLTQFVSERVNIINGVTEVRAQDEDQVQELEPAQEEQLEPAQARA